MLLGVLLCAWVIATSPLSSASCRSLCAQMWEEEGKGVMDGTKYQGFAMCPTSCLDQRSQEGIHLMEHFSYCMEQPSPVPRALLHPSGPPSVSGQADVNQNLSPKTSAVTCSSWEGI